MSGCYIQSFAVSKDIHFFLLIIIISLTLRPTCPVMGCYEFCHPKQFFKDHPVVKEAYKTQTWGPWYGLTKANA